jgi:hypothetical protein
MTLANEITNTFKNFKTFTFRDVRMVLAAKHKRISDKTVQVTLSRMVKKKKICKIVKGVFSLERRDEIIGFAFTPFYYGGLAALMIRDLIDDQVKMEVMTTRRVKRSFIEVYGGTSVVALHHIPKKYYFGFENLKYGNIVVPVSNPEKTLIDLFYYKKRVPPQDYGELLKRVRIKVLRKYLKTYDKRTAKIVTDFVREYRKAATSGKMDNPY